MTEEHQAGGGRPLITVSEDYATLPNLNIIVRNSGGGPAKNISFEFSDRIVSSDGFVLSDRPSSRRDYPPWPRVLASHVIGIPSKTSCHPLKKGRLHPTSQLRCGTKTLTRDPMS